MTRIYHRNPDLIIREVENQFFLIDEEGGWIDHLNETASAIWRLLETPQSANEVIAAFRFLFPNEDVHHIKQAIRVALKDLAARDILMRRRG